MSLFRSFEKKPLMPMPRSSDDILGMGLPSDVASIMINGVEGRVPDLRGLGDAVQSLFRKKRPQVDWEGGGYNKPLEPEPFDISKLFLRGSI